MVYTQNYYEEGVLEIKDFKIFSIALLRSGNEG